MVESPSKEIRIDWNQSIAPEEHPIDRATIISSGRVAESEWRVEMVDVTEDTYERLSPDRDRRQ
ncbi:hypothetical protein [Natrinema sp. 1APR25-10V2]|uniref:hypothetical protein n=1 Tax=Natrinema sp. 1APR25-10V2 TaxID=2951081 RepID=UPI0028757FC9|nr:hypothetical protein [Natrinema sp. 1APR25-10V2]MDS0477912.1 hypothetical protein [Natrinema sp. 1APR25-10V2]